MNPDSPECTMQPLSFVVREQKLNHSPYTVWSTLICALNAQKCTEITFPSDLQAIGRQSIIRYINLIKHTSLPSYIKLLFPINLLLTKHHHLQFPCISKANLFILTPMYLGMQVICMVYLSIQVFIFCLSTSKETPGVAYNTSKVQSNGHAPGTVLDSMEASVVSCLYCLYYKYSSCLLCFIEMWSVSLAWTARLAYLQNMLFTISFAIYKRMTEGLFTQSLFSAFLYLGKMSISYLHITEFAWCLEAFQLDHQGCNLMHSSIYFPGNKQMFSKVCNLCHILTQPAS